MVSTVEITALAHGGDGIGRINGQVCFVPYGLPGDTLRVKVTREAKRALWAAIEEVVEPSPDRIHPAPPGFGNGGACTWLHFAYPTQAIWKQHFVQDALARLGGIETEVAWLEEPGLRLSYRTRAEFHGDGKHLGFFALGTRRIVDTEVCPLSHRKLNVALRQLRRMDLKGSATVTVNPEGDEVMVWTTVPMPNIQAQFPLSNWKRDGKHRDYFLFDGVPVVNGTFCQASLILNRMLVREVHSAVGRVDRLLDLYCGCGNLTMGLAEDMHVEGIDQNRPAIRAANQMRKGFYKQGEESVMRKTVQDESWDCILLDPPRQGAKDLMPALAKAKTDKIVYASCDPPTLARDLAILIKGGWKVDSATAIDMFPYTPHVETVCVLTRAS